MTIVESYAIKHSALPRWTAIAFIAAPRKSNGGNRPTTSGDLTTRRKSGSAANQFESDGDWLGIQRTE